MESTIPGQGSSRQETTRTVADALFLALISRRYSPEDAAILESGWEWSLRRIPVEDREGGR